MNAAPAPAAPIDLEQLRRRVRELPALPQAVMEALAGLRDESTSSEHCAELIARDPALAARSLRLANSAFYGVPGRVASVHDAVALLGRRTLSSLLLVTTLSQQFNAGACPGFVFASFWRHAVAVALVARALAGLHGQDEERAFTVGLLHDIGRLALAAHFPAQTAAALQALRAQDDEGPHPGLPASEQPWLGTDHVQVGALVAAQWRFPPAVVAAIAEHHAPRGGVVGAAASLADIVHVADAVAHALDLAGDALEAVPPVDAKAWNRLALTPALLFPVFASAEAGVEELCHVLGL